MTIFDRYILKNLAIATVFVSVVMAVIVFLTQSLKFLELVINAGASGSAFWMLTLLALPRFFEIILPFSLMTAVIFIYNRMSLDSELVVARSGGYSTLSLLRPALFLAAFISVVLYVTTMWAAPKALAHLHETRQIIKAQVSSLLFREGVFNRAGSGVMVYVRERPSTHELRGVLIYDARDESQPPAIILAKRGQAEVGGSGYRVTVYDGSRQQFDREKHVLQKLNFQQYTVDFASSDKISARWSEPEERTIFQLLHPDLTSVDDRNNMRDFKMEIHRRILLPLLAPLYVLIAGAALLQGPVNRQKGAGKRIVLAVVSVLIVQALFLSFFSLSRKGDLGLYLMYTGVFVPYIFAIVNFYAPRYFKQRFFAKTEVDAS